MVRRDALLTSAAGQTRRVSLLAIAAVPFNSAGTRSRPASAEAENAALLWPGERQAGMGEQLLRGEVARMPAFEDRPRDIGSEIGQPEHPGEI